MKKLFTLLSLILLLGCGSSTPKQVNDTENSQKETLPSCEVSLRLYDELFRIIDLNDAGKMPDSEFKPRADALKLKIDEHDALLTNAQKDAVKAYGQQLLEELVTKKMNRTK